MSSTDFRSTAKNKDASAVGGRGNPPPRTASLKEAEEQEKYNHFYKRIYPSFRKGNVDFRALAQQTCLPERRIRESILVRFNPDDTRQLMGHRPGVCYTCNRKVPETHLHEPICLICLESVAKAIQALFPDTSSAETTPTSEPTAPVPEKKQPGKDMLQDILNEPASGSFVVDTHLPPQESIRHFGFQRLKAWN